MKIRIQVLDENARKLWGHSEVECGRSKLCKAVGISEPSYYCRLRSPEKMTLREMRVLYRVGKLTDEQILSAIREDTA